MADSKEGPEDDSKPAQKENVGKKRKLAKDDGLRVPSTKAWHEGEAHQGPIKVWHVFPSDGHQFICTLAFAMLCNQSCGVQSWFQSMIAARHNSYQHRVQTRMAM